MARRSISRRAFLRGLGAVGALSPFIPLLNANATTAAPRRLVLFYTPHGHYLPLWTPNGTSASFTLNSSMAPLNRHLSKINILGNVSMKGYFHENGSSQLWTGEELLDGPGGAEPTYNPTHPSVDQVVAQSLGNATLYPFLHYGVSSGGAYGLYTRTSWGGTPVQPIEPNQDPVNAWQTLFAQNSSQTLADNASVLDTVAGDLTALRGRISSADAYKLDSHLTSVRALETRLQTQSVACAGPDFNTDPLTQISGSDASQLAQFIDIIGAALACDLTRVVNMQFKFSSNDGDVYTWLNNTGGHHTLTHATPSDTTDENSQPVGSQAASVNGQLTATDLWYSQMFARLLDVLDAIPEGNGTVLDSTLVVWGTELNHCDTHACGVGGAGTCGPAGTGLVSAQYITAGGGATGLANGRYLIYPGSINDDPEHPQTEHNRLLVSMAQYMGLSTVQTFGPADLGSGPLPGF